MVAAGAGLAKQYERQGVFQSRAQILAINAESGGVRFEVYTTFM
jgi:hypothetical protein